MTSSIPYKALWTPGSMGSFVKQITILLLLLLTMLTANIYSVPLIYQAQTKVFSVSEPIFTTPHGVGPISVLIL